MKRKVTLAILGAVLHGNAYASEPKVASEPSSNKEQAVQTVPAAKSRTKTVQGRKSKPKVKTASEDKVDPQSNARQNAVTEPTPGSIEQPVQLKGVRG